MSARTPTTYAPIARLAPWGDPWPDDGAATASYTPMATVLVCEDDEDTREIISVLLSRHGLRVLEAATGDSALHLARTRDVSAIILDIVLPDCTGFDVCQELRQDPRTRRLPVVMMTALTDITHESTAIVAGADAYLVKPVRHDELLRTILKII